MLVGFLLDVPVLLNEFQNATLRWEFELRIPTDGMPTDWRGDGWKISSLEKSWWLGRNDFETVKCPAFKFLAFVRRFLRENFKVYYSLLSPNFATFSFDDFASNMGHDSEFPPNFEPLISPNYRVTNDHIPNDALRSLCGLTKDRFFVKCKVSFPSMPCQSSPAHSKSWDDLMTIPEVVRTDFTTDG